MKIHRILLVLFISFLLCTFIASAADCEEEGNLLCAEGNCNIGHPQCNLESPPKTYTIPDGKKCTYSGSIKNSGCAWQNPATLTVSGSDCTREISYYNCATRYFSFTCNEPGTISFSADDSSEFSISYSCVDKPTKCEEEGHMLCTDERCNIGDSRCNPSDPPKKYTVPPRERCTFTGSIKNTGCAWINPATLTVVGNDCNREIEYKDCGTKYFSFTCRQGDVSISADDSSFIDLDYNCEPEGYCGDGFVDADDYEECEYPFPYGNYENNPSCGQSSWDCNSNNQYATRDHYGDCDILCRCEEDGFSNYKCTPGYCNAKCDSDDDCDDNNPDTIDKCKDDCKCTNTYNPYCGNGVVDPGEECEQDYDCDDEDPFTIDKCKNNCECSYEDKPPVCGNNIIEPGEDCEDDSDCNDGDPSTKDKCDNDCQCTNNPGVCGNGVLEFGEECEKPSTFDNHYCKQSNETCDGKRFGVRGDFGNCNSRCDCSFDSFTYSCEQDKCNAECDSDDDCDDGDSSTDDFCKNNCECSSAYNPTCGNNIVDPGEDCEEDDDCPENYFCDSKCDCKREGYCGNEEIDPGEECDDGAYNGLGCNPGKNASCLYCDVNCTLTRVGPGVCGDGNIDAYEQCDGGADNGNECTPACDRSCFFCMDDCMVRWVTGDPCGPDPHDPPDVPDLPPFYYYGGYGGGYTYTRHAICGNGIVEVGENCDNGNSNGIPCSASCDSSCDYCSGACQDIVLTGGPCVRRPRPWDTGVIGYYCESLLLIPYYAHLDNVCGNHGEDVTFQTSDSDNMYSTQYGCDNGFSYMYLYYGDVRYAAMLQEAGIYVEHKEYLARAWLEYLDGRAWKELCQLPIRRGDTIDACSLEGVDFENVSMRIKIKSSGPDAFEMVDLAYINMTYCHSPNTICGNGMIEGNEECDDGNLIGGDGCNQICKMEYWLCGDWSECIDGEQGQTCIYGDEIKVKKRLCERKDYTMLIFIIVLIILIIILFLLPYLFYVFVHKKREEEEN